MGFIRGVGFRGAVEVGDYQGGWGLGERLKLGFIRGVGFRGAVEVGDYQGGGV